MSSNGTEISERVVRLLGVGSAVSQVIAFSFVGVFALDSLTYGIAVGGMSGIGAYLFIPWFLQLSTVQQNATDDLPLAAAIQQVPGRPQPRLFGLGLELGALVMLMIAFTRDEPNLISGIAGGLTVALFVYFVGSVGLSRLTAAVD